MIFLRSFQGFRVGAAMAVALLWVCATSAEAVITGSVHDFSGEGWSGGQICNVCHTPHNASVDVDAPLWNHTISSAVYKTYSSATMDMPAEQPGPGSYSRMCLSCHDGTVAVDSFGGSSSDNSRMIKDYANLGTDLTNDHPIGVKWGGLEQGGHSANEGDLTTCLNCHDWLNSGDNIGKEVKFFGPKGSRTVECPSCHDVHNSKVMDVKLLRLPLENSELCMRCHSK